MVADADVYAGVRSHLSEFWPRTKQEEFSWTLGPIAERLPLFKVRRVRPRRGDPWIYVTVGSWASTAGDPHGTEFFLMSATEDPRHVELLAMVANFHADHRYRLDVGSVLNVGRPWADGSAADHLLVSLPYPFGPALENLTVENRHIRFLWLVPITASEAAFRRKHGLEALEQRLEQGVDVLDPARAPVA